MVCRWYDGSLFIIEHTKVYEDHEILEGYIFNGIKEGIINKTKCYAVSKDGEVTYTENIK